MVSQHDLCGRTQLFDVSENLKRVRSSIYQVADEPQSRLPRDSKLIRSTS